MLHLGRHFAGEGGNVAHVERLPLNPGGTGATHLGCGGLGGVGRVSNLGRRLLSPYIRVPLHAQGLGFKGRHVSQSG